MKQLNILINNNTESSYRSSIGNMSAQTWNNILRSLGSLYYSKNNYMTHLVDTPKNQHEAVLWHLNEYNTITSWEAIKEYGATRLSAIIYNLRDNGYIITTNMKTTKNRFGRNVNYSEYKWEHIF